MEPTMSPISIDKSFRFDCSQKVPCFNACCRDLNQFLTPFDILRLKKHLGVTSTEFLSTYTSQHIGPQTGLPVVSLRPKNDDNLLCPFVSPDGCQVYANRPTSCRLYPIARAIAPCPQTDKISEHFALIKEPHCQGFHQKSTQTVRQWLLDQGVRPYLAVNDRFLDIIRLKNHQHPAPLDLRASHLFQLAFYDLDGFRSHLLDNRLVETDGVSSGQAADLEHNDTSLLLYAHRWIAAVLFRTPEKE